MIKGLFAGALAGTLVFCSPAAAADVFTLSNSNADGFFTQSGSGYALTGGNNGSGTSGSTLLTASAGSSVRYSGTFQYSTSDDPGYDFAGYTVNGTRTQLAAANGARGSFSFDVARGDTYGFYVDTADNIGGAGTLSVTPSAASAGPEPTSWAMMIVGFGLVGGTLRRSRLGGAPTLAARV